MRTLFDSEDEYHYELVRVGNAFNESYMEYESRDDKNKKLSIEEYLNKVRPYLKNMINDLKLQGQWKFQLSITINFFSSNKTCTMHLSYDW